MYDDAFFTSAATVHVATVLCLLVYKVYNAIDEDTALTFPLSFYRTSA